MMKLFLLALFLLLQVADSVVLNGYLIEFLGFESNVLTYAITSDGDEEFGLSHWTLGIEACGEIISPPESPPSYFSVIVSPACDTRNCQVAEYELVEYGPDPTLGGLSGIKFADSSSQLSAENQATHVFQVELSEGYQQGDVQVGVKTGSTEGVGQVRGAVCSPTNVGITKVEASAGTPWWAWLLLCWVGASLLFAAFWSRFQRIVRRGLSS